MGTSSNVVLIVDDSPTIRKNLSQTLKEAGFVVLSAEDGEKGIEAVLKNDQIELIISDVHMPKMSGLEMVSYLKQNGFDKPIIMLTQERRDDFVAHAKKVGAIGWIVKPFRKEEIVQIVTQIFKSVA